MRIVRGRPRFRREGSWSKLTSGMNDDQPGVTLDALKAEHRELDERIQLLSAEPTGDQLELARLKRRKLMLKDRIQLMVNANIPDIIA